MKSLHLMIGTALWTTMIAACATEAPPGDDEAGDPEVATSSATFDAQVVDQLTKSANGLATQDLPLKIVKYTAAAPLDSAAAVQSVKQAILDGGSLVPQYDGTNASSFSLDTIATRTQAFQAGTDDQNIVANIQNMALANVKQGQKVFNVTWDNQGHQFQTKLVYDANGVVYDNVLSNLVVVDAEPPPTRDGAPVAPATDVTDAAAKNQSFTATVVNLTLKWIWGAKRGSIVIRHFVITCDGWKTFCDDGGDANASMELGSADARTHRHSLDKKKRLSDLAWAYAWATPTAGFSISWHADKLDFTVKMSGIGSRGHGVGIHTIF